MDAFVQKEFCVVPVPFDTINGTPEGKNRYTESIFVQPAGQQMTTKLRVCVGERSKNGLSRGSSKVRSFPETVTPT